MSIADILTPTQCELVNIGLCFDHEGNLTESVAEIDVYNASGKLLIRVPVDIPWTAQERAAIEANITEKYGAFKALNEFTEYIGPDL